MGLFTNNKKGCPVCGNPTPRLFPTKVEGNPICKECAQKIYLPDGKLKEMSADDFIQYINFYDENQTLRDLFFETFHHNFGFIGDDLMVDTAHGLFRTKNLKEALVFEAANLKDFRILEDETLLFEGGKESFKKFESDIPEKVKAMSTVVAQFRILLQEYEMREARERERQERARERGETITTRYVSRPTLDTKHLFEKFVIEITLDHPYWNEIRWEVKAPEFDYNYPSVEDYLVDYENKAEQMHAIAVNLMQLINPNIQEEFNGTSNCLAETQAEPVMSGVEEIKKYKELLDMGIITEEEFAVKKHELLGL